ncbi:MAG: TatD family hydrolase [Magnetococcales bacterium]|nr:TatD family hydrolase [Magnetococcales bacterium]
MIDTHCHLDFPHFDADREAVWRRALAVGVVGGVVPGVCLRDFGRVVALRAPGMWIALGLHPCFLAEHPPDALAQLESRLLRDQPVAVGEIGLDHLLSAETHALQLGLLEGQLRLAERFRLPVLLHVRRAHDLVISVLRRLAFRHGGIVHAFGGSLQQAEAYIKMGFCLGIGGVVTYERSRRIRQVAAALPEECLVVESDAPDLTPAAHYGERNEPAFLPEVVAVLAALRRTDPEQIRMVTSRNARRVLGLQGA